MELRIMTEEEIAAARVDAALWEAAEEERQQQVKACAGHEWEMELFHPEDDAYVSLSCTRCPAGSADVLGEDMVDLVYAEFDGGIEVVEGKHNSLEPLIVPVTVNVHGYSHWTDYGEEWDVDIEIEQRGPARPVDVTPDIATTDRSPS